jgi:hypothetical protein
MKKTVITKIYASRNHDGRYFIEFDIKSLLAISSAIKAYVIGKMKNLRITGKFKGHDKPINLTMPIEELIKNISKKINISLRKIENNIEVEKDYIKKLLKRKSIRNDSFIFIKLHLFLQELLWSYVECKLIRRPKQYENWNFLQLVDLVESFNEIPPEIISYFYSLNTLRNKIAHKPTSLKFDNIHNKYRVTLYKSGNSLYGIKKEPSSNNEIFDDWISLFVLSIIFIGDLLPEKKAI